MPDYQMQRALLQTAINQTGFSWDTISLLEAHGSGTFLGDSQEFRALKIAFEEQTKRKSYCALGALKTNIGHLEAAGGLAGLIKAVLCLEKGFIPPNSHFREPNKEITFEDSSFFWPDKVYPLIN